MIHEDITSTFVHKRSWSLVGAVFKKLAADWKMIEKMLNYTISSDLVGQIIANDLLLEIPKFSKIVFLCGCLF